MYIFIHILQAYFIGTGAGEVTLENMGKISHSLTITKVVKQEPCI